MNRELPRNPPKIEFFKGSQLVTETSPCKTNVRNAFSIEIYPYTVIFTRMSQNSIITLTLWPPPREGLFVFFRGEESFPPSLAHRHSSPPNMRTRKPTSRAIHRTHDPPLDFSSHDTSIATVKYSRFAHHSQLCEPLAHNPI